MWFKKLAIFLVMLGSTVAYSSGSSKLSFASAVKKANPCVVAIQVEKSLKKDFSPIYSDSPVKEFLADDVEEDGPSIRSMGSGFIVSKDGYILTNYHVIKDTKDLIIKMEDGREFPGKVIAYDPPSDLGVVKINGDHLPVAKLGDSEALQVGDVVLAIGNPFGVGQTVTQGIVSALNRKNLGLNLYEGYIQTDASINPGNSGGALINLDGEVIGVNTAILSRSGGNNGIGFAIPITYAQQIMNDLISTGQVERGWLGLIMAELNSDIRKLFHYPQGEGVLVRAVYAKSPAAIAGILPGDIVIKINNKKMRDSSDVRQKVTEMRPGENANIFLMREGKPLTISATIVKRESIE